MRINAFCRLVRQLFLVAAAMSFVLAPRAVAGEPASAIPSAETETILSTYHVRAGQEQAFLAAVNKTWSIYRRLDVVLPRPHILVRKVDEAGQAIYVELFTWRSGDIPDHAPSEIKAAWKELELLCKRPDGHSGIEGEEVSVASTD